MIDDDLLKRTLESVDGTEQKLQLVIPKSKVREVLQELHDGTSRGHLGIKKTLEKVRKRSYWIHRTDDVKDSCRKPVHRVTALQGNDGPL